MSRVRKVARLILATLREIGDERAYQRHLDAHGRSHSAAEWRRFSTARQEARYTRPKCC
jgi:hypothetical protein